MASLRDALDTLAANAQLCSLEPFRREAALRLAILSEDVQQLARGRLLFSATEIWRTVYESVLESSHSRRYLSTALVRSENYWRHPPGDKSLQLNYQLVSQGSYIHRLLIIDEFLWPPGAKLPSRELLHWISDQYDHGIEISLIRENQLEGEHQLIADFGIYGDLAVGHQTTDEDGLTVKYELRFDPASICAAEANWKKLLLYATAWKNLVDQSES